MILMGEEGGNKRLKGIMDRVKIRRKSIYLSSSYLKIAYICC